MSLSAHVVVIKDEEILLIQRADFKIWVCPALGAALSGNEMCAGPPAGSHREKRSPRARGVLPESFDRRGVRRLLLTHRFPHSLSSLESHSGL